MKRLLSLVVAGALCLALAAPALAAEIAPIKTPVLLTSLGQAADVNTMNILAKRAKLPVTYKPLATAADLADVKTMLLNVGVSLKGFGSAGVNLETETVRAKELFKAAKDKGVYIILTHIGGEERRDHMSNLMLEVAAPQADAFIVFEEGNRDGYFAKAAGAKPLVLLPKNMEMVKVLSDLAK